MIKNYIKVSLRNIFKNKSASIISLLSLVLSISFAVVIVNYTQIERSFDEHIPNIDDKFRLTYDIYGDKGRNVHDAESPAPYAPFFKSNTIEIKQYVRFKVDNNTLLINPGIQSLKSDYVVWSDNGILDFFGIDLIAGNKSLEDLNSLLISRSTANQLYGDVHNVVGKSLQINDNRSFVVSGVFEDLPHNSTVKFEVIGAIDVLQEIMPWYYRNGENWGGYAFNTYFEFQKNSDVSQIVESFQNQYRDRFDIDLNNLPEEYHDFDLINVADIHLHSDVTSEITPVTNLKKLRILEGLALMIAIIGWINFMNIQSARAPERLKEIAVRRSFGANLFSLRFLFLCEYLIINLISVSIALYLATQIFPDWIEKWFDIELLQFRLDGLSVFILIIGVLLTSVYPALIAAGQTQSTSVVKSFRTNIPGKVRNMLVSFQFVTALSYLYLLSLSIYKSNL